jgi:precorrin-6B methylase 1
MSQTMSLLLNALVKRLSQAQHKVRAFKSGDELFAGVGRVRKATFSASC